MGKPFAGDVATAEASFQHGRRSIPAGLRLTQQKTGARLVVPFQSELQRGLAAAPRDHLTILNTAFGRPFSIAGFGQFMRGAIRAAGLPLECRPHGLRKAAGRRLAEAGCTSREVVAMLGHRRLAEAERYMRDADQERLARAAIIKLKGGKENKSPQTGRKNLGMKLKNERKSAC